MQALKVVGPAGGYSSGWKDTVVDIAAIGKFVWNLAAKALAEAIKATSADEALTIDGLQIAGLDVLLAILMEPPRVKGGPVHLERRLYPTGQVA